MKTNEKKNTSAKKKLIPAVAMLTTSAVMLSTATYAWFTMSREVEVTGLQMSATASDALEISLGEVAKGTNTIGADLAKQPADTDAEISWTKRIDISEYYSTVDLLMPASTVNGKDSLMQLMQQTQVNLQVRLLPQQRKQKLTREMQRRQSLILLLIRITAAIMWTFLFILEPPNIAQQQKTTQYIAR